MMPSVVLSPGLLRADTAGMADRWERISSALRGLWCFRYAVWISVEGLVSMVKRSVDSFSEMTPL